MLKCFLDSSVSKLYAFRSKQDRRVVVAPDLVIIILRSVYFALYNNHRSEAMKALQAMQKRARYELSSQVTNSVMIPIDSGVR